MRSSNPGLKKDTFSKFGGLGQANPMTIEGTVNKTFFMLILLCASAFFTWTQYFNGEDVFVLMIAGLISALIVAIVLMVAPKFSPFLAPLYAIMEGLFIGGISAIYEEKFNGITTQAVLITFSILLALLFAYRTKLIKPTENFKLGVVAATGGIALVYLIDIILHFFGLNVPFIHDTGWVGILISLFIVGIAALNLVLDFDFIESGVEQQAPKYMEWYAAFGLMVTLVWLYLEILRLLSKLNSRN